MNVFSNTFVVLVVNAIARFTTDMQGRVRIGQPQEETLDAELEPLFSMKSEQQVCSHPQAQAPATLMSGRQQHSRLLLAQVVTVHFKFVISTLPLQ